MLLLSTNVRHQFCFDPVKHLPVVRVLSRDLQVARAQVVLIHAQLFKAPDAFHERLEQFFCCVFLLVRDKRRDDLLSGLLDFLINSWEHRPLLDPLLYDLLSPRVLVQGNPSHFLDVSPSQGEGPTTSHCNGESHVNGR